MRTVNPISNGARNAWQRVTRERRKCGRTVQRTLCGRRLTTGTAGSVTATVERLRDQERGDIMIDMGVGFIIGFFVASVMWGVAVTIADAIAEKIGKDDKK